MRIKNGLLKAAEMSFSRMGLGSLMYCDYGLYICTFMYAKLLNLFPQFGLANI
jgi:hypothetical protein